MLRNTSRTAVTLLALAGMAAHAQGSSATGKAQVPVRDYARKSSFESAKISPKGDYLAVTIPAEGQTVLGVIDLKSHKVSGVLRFTRGEHVHRYWWVGPERVVVSIANRAGPLDQPRLTGELYGMNADGSDRKYLFGYRGEQQVGSNIRKVVAEHAWAWMFDALPHEPDWALIAVVPWARGRDMNNPILERIHASSGTRKRVGVVPGYGPLDAAADRHGRVRFAYSNDARSLHHLYVAADTPTGWKEVPHPGGAPVEVDLHGATPDGNSVFLTSHEAGGRGCLREYRFDRDTLADVVCDATGRVGRPIFSFDDDRLLGFTHEPGKPQVQFLEPQHDDARLLQSLMKAFGDQRVAVTSRTLDGKKLVVRVDGDRNPGDYFLVDRQTRKADYLISERSWIDPATQVPTAPITYRTRDGATIHGYLTVPGGLKARKAPLVVLPHGGPHGIRDYWQWDAWAQLLASRGYAALQVNYRGSGGYGKPHEEAGYRKWGTLMQDDLTDGVRWAIAEDIADPARACIMGASYGGYAAVMSATREPDLYRCVIGFAGVYDLVEQAADSDTAEYRMGRNYLQRVLGDESAMREQSPVTHVARLEAPVLIAHGTADRRVPFSQAKLLRKALDKHGKAYEWLEFPGEEHGFYDDANHEAFLGKALEFLEKHIGKPAP